MKLTALTIYGSRLVVLGMSFGVGLPCLGQQASAQGDAKTSPVEYAVAGRLTWEPSKPDRAASSSFSVIVSGEKWMIRVVPDDADAVLTPLGAGGRTAVKDFEVASYDGKWFYLVHSYESTRDIRSRSGRAASGWRVGSNHPCFSASTELLALWAVYASSGYFAERNPRPVDRSLWANGSCRKRPRFCRFPWMSVIPGYPGPRPRP